MSLQEVARAEPGDNLFYAHVSALWAGGTLKKAQVVVDEFLVVDRRRNGIYHLNKSSTLTGGQTKVLDGSPQDHDLKRSRRAAIMALYKKMVCRISLVASHPDVLAGKVSEGAAVLEGLT